MQLKFESNSDPRKKFHMLNRSAPLISCSFRSCSCSCSCACSCSDFRLRKARKYAEQLYSVCGESDKVDARTKLETQAYHAWLAGIALGVVESLSHGGHGVLEPWGSWSP